MVVLPSCHVAPPFMPNSICISRIWYIAEPPRSKSSQPRSGSCGKALYNVTTLTSPPRPTFVKTPSFLLTISTTPMTCPRMVMGMHRIVLVSYPVCSSTALLNLGKDSCMPGYNFLGQMAPPASFLSTSGLCTRQSRSWSRPSLPPSPRSPRPPPCGSPSSCPGPASRRLRLRRPFANFLPLRNCQAFDQFMTHYTG